MWEAKKERWMEQFARKNNIDTSVPGNEATENAAIIIPANFLSQVKQIEYLHIKTAIMLLIDDNKANFLKFSNILNSSIFLIFFSLKL